MIYLIVPVYNVEKYLRKCLDSIFSQTFTDFFVLCINDGSTDNSLKIIEEYKKKYSNLIIINKTNGGLSSARNFGLDSIYSIFQSDDLIMFIDSDDYISDDYLSIMNDSLIHSGADIVCSKYFDVNNDDFNEVDLFNGTIELNSNYDGLLKLFSGEIQSHGPCKLYRANLWKNIRYDENIYFLEDQSTIFKTFINANKIATIQYKGYYYRHRLGSICQSHMTNKKILSALKSYFYTYTYPFEFLDNQNLLLKEKTLEQFINAYLMLYPRFDFTNSADENNEMKKYILFLKENKKDIKMLNLSKKNKIKYRIYLFSKKFYKKIYSHFLKEYDNK